MSGDAVLHHLGKAKKALFQAQKAWKYAETDEDQRAEAAELLDRIRMRIEGFKGHDWDAEMGS